MSMTNKIKLYDSGKQLLEIRVCSLFCNNALYLQTLFGIFTEMEDMYDITFVYCFLENKSTDDTREMLKNFIQSRKGSKLICYKNDEGYRKTRLGQDFKRTNYLATLRNKLIQVSKPFRDDEWCLLLDSDIYFRANILQQMFTGCPNPSSENIGALTPYTQQLLPNDMIRKAMPDIPLDADADSDSPTNAKLLHHYFDTFSFFINNKSYFPYCCFEKCSFCQAIRPENNDKPLVPASQDLVDIDSGFGGFCLVKGSLLNNPQVKWGTLALNYDSSLSLCEHVMFFQSIRQLQKKVILLQHVDCLFRTG
jgi:hypothetical protein